MKKNIVCPCGKNLPFEYEEELDLDAKPEALQSIFDGTFMSVSCPSCGKLHKPEFKVTLDWKSKNYKLTVIPELDRGEFYRNKKEKTEHETIISFPEMAERIAVIKDDLEPVVIETLKSYLLAKAEENYPENEINAWYYCLSPEGIEFHLDGIKHDEVAVMRISLDMYNKTLEDYKKQPKSRLFASLRVRSYLSVKNLLRPDVLK